MVKSWCTTHKYKKKEHTRLKSVPKEKKFIRKVNKFFFLNKRVKQIGDENDPLP